MIKTLTAEMIHRDISVMLSNGVSYVEALVEYSKQKDIEIETLADIIKRSTILKEKVRQEAIQAKTVTDDANNDITKLCE